MKERKPEALNEIRVRVPRDCADAVGDFIVETICHGFVVEDEESADFTTIIFYSNLKDTASQTRAVQTFLSGAPGRERTPDSTVTVREIANLAWEEEYRRSVAPLVIAGDIIVRPPWAEPPVPPRYDIVIEPKMAFGTGTHETTRSCLQVIRKRLQPGMRVLDLGCGSGILSILADKMGAAYIKAIDYDVVAVDNCRENFDINHLRAAHEVLFGSIEKTQGDEPYQLVVANIIKSTILEMVDKLAGLTARPGVLVLSGLLVQDMDEVEPALDCLGATERETLADNEWRTVTVLFR